MKSSFPISSGFLQSIQEEEDNDQEVPSHIAPRRNARNSRARPKAEPLSSVSLSTLEEENPSNIFQLSYIRSNNNHNDSDARSHISSARATDPRRAPSDAGAMIAEDGQEEHAVLVLSNTPTARRRPFSFVRPPPCCYPKFWNRKQRHVAAAVLVLTVTVLVAIVYVAIVVPTDDLLETLVPTLAPQQPQPLIPSREPTLLPTVSEPSESNPTTTTTSLPPTFPPTPIPAPPFVIVTTPPVTVQDTAFPTITLAPTTIPVEQGLDAILFNTTVTSEADWQNASSAASRARQWMLETDLLREDVLSAGATRVLQRFGLAVLYFATHADQAVGLDFLALDATECNWEGVFCDDGVDDVVVYLNLTRSTDAASVVGGTLPMELVHVSSLRELTLHAGLTGPLQSEWFLPDYWPDLYWLDLRSNLLTGPLPVTLWEKELLRFVYLSENAFTGSIPDGLDDMTASYLQDVRLSNNLLTGSLPAWLSQVSTLDVWIAHDNQLTGSMPAALPENVTMLDLAGNQLNGSLPDALFGHETLQYLYLEDNDLSGPLPAVATAENENALKHVWLNDNALTGTIPDGFAESWSNLEILQLHNNSLTGTLGPTTRPVVQQATCRLTWPALTWMQADCLEWTTGGVSTPVQCGCCDSCEAP